MSSSSSVAVKRRRLNKKTPAEGAAAEEPSVGADAEEARLGQIILVKQVDCGRSRHFIYSIPDPEGAVSR